MPRARSRLDRYLSVRLYCVPLRRRTGSLADWGGVFHAVALLPACRQCTGRVRGAKEAQLVLWCMVAGDRARPRLEGRATAQMPRWLRTWPAGASRFHYAADSSRFECASIVRIYDS